MAIRLPTRNFDVRLYDIDSASSKLLATACSDAQAVSSPSYPSSSTRLILNQPPLTTDNNLAISSYCVVSRLESRSIPYCKLHAQNTTAKLSRCPKFKHLTATLTGARILLHRRCSAVVQPSCASTSSYIPRGHGDGLLAWSGRSWARMKERKNRRSSRGSNMRRFMRSINPCEKFSD